MNKRKIKILFIDDEVHNLQAFKSSFRFDYDIYTTISAFEAEEWLERNEVDMILCDHRMPNKTGVEFFATIIKTHPKPTRILVTGYSDIESVIKAINQGHVFRYIIKPWNDTEIKSTIEEAYRFYMQSTQLENKVAELTLAYKELDNFAYSVSHDLKGPLMSIMGAMSIVNQTENKNEESIKTLLSLTEKAAEQLGDFIENMHVYYKNNRGQLRIEKVLLEKIRDEVLVIHKLKCLQDKINLNFSINNNSPLFSTDVTKLKVIINNLISNALKYQRKNEPNKRVDVNITTNGEQMQIEITDNGMGIEEHYLKSIFNLFFRANSEVEGNGFGLYNVNEIVTVLGGKIEVVSKINEGSNFMVTLPSK